MLLYFLIILRDLYLYSNWTHIIMIMFLPGTLTGVFLASAALAAAGLILGIALGAGAASFLTAALVAGMAFAYCYFLALWKLSATFSDFI